MNYFIVKPTTTVGSMKRACEEDEQQIFPYVNDNNIYEGLIFAKDLNDCADSSTASQVLAQAKKSGDNRDVYVLTTQPSTDAKEILRRRNLQFVPVVDGNHRIVGTIDGSS